MARTLVQGSTGDDVRSVQDMLNYHLRRETPLAVDGIFGPKTFARVKLFQSRQKLKDDGIVGKLTNAALFEVHEYQAQAIVFPQLTLPTFQDLGGFGIKQPRLIPPLTFPQTPQLVLPSPVTFLPPITLTNQSSATFLAVRQPSVLNMTFSVVPVKDPADPFVQSTENLIQLVNDLPVDSKFRAFLISQIPRPISKIAEPNSSFSFKPFKPSYNPFDPNKIGNTSSAAFRLRIFGRPGDVTPQIALEGRAEGKIELEYTGNAASNYFKATSEWNFALGLGGTF